MMNTEINEILGELYLIEIDNPIYDFDKPISECKKKKSYLPKVIELAERYAKSDDNERASIRTGVKEDACCFLRNFSADIAIEANRTGNMQLLFSALILHSIDDFRDWRDNGPHIIAINHEIKKSGEDFGSLYEKVAQLSSENGAGHFQEFKNISFQ
jgi:hypothetical protein